MKTYVKFGALVVAIIGTLVWLAAGGISETKTYYKTISELGKMGSGAMGKRLRVGGDVENGSIVRKGRAVEFTLRQDTLRLKVVYNGNDPLPDTFRDGAQALADGKMGADGVFQASKIQAKCASKYQAKPGSAPAPLNKAGA
jgi:cytochrome c-type biogenesis protein CcmE